MILKAESKIKIKIGNPVDEEGFRIPQRIALTVLTVLIIFTIMTVLCTAMVWGKSEPKVDPRTGLIRLLFMGDALMEPGFVTPLIHQDPMIKMNPIPVEFLTGEYESIEHAAKRMRIYLPRVERQLVEEYDVVIIADAREPFFPRKFQNWIKDGVVEHGLGFLMGGGPQSFGGLEEWGHPSWEGSPIADILPVKLLSSSYGREAYSLSQIYRLVPTDENHPLVRGIPWKYIPLFCRNRVLERQGSMVVGRSDRYPPKSPILTYMEMGNGMSEAFVFDWGGNGVKKFHRWDYAPIVMSNLIYWIARVEIPEDTALLLQLRTELTKYFSMRRYAISVIDFAEKFGANTNKAQKALTESDQDREAIMHLYVDGDYEQCISKLDSALGKLDQVTQLAMEAKDQALLWVYIIEWFTVSGTSMLSGAILWTLMVRRVAYKEVKATRFDAKTVKE